MPDSVSELIYEKFLEKLADKENLRPETIEALKALYRSGRLANRTSLAQLAQQMEVRHAQNQQHNNQ
jgi:hypothetical protein